MRIKDKALIEYYGKKDIDEKTLAKRSNMILLRFIDHPNIDVDEAISIINQFPTIEFTVNIIANDAQTIENTIKRLPERANVIVLGIRKEIINDISKDVASRVSNIALECGDRDINIGDIRNKFPNVNHIFYNTLLEIGTNITNLTQITYLLERTEKLFLEPKLLVEYQEYLENHPEIKLKLGFGYKSIYNLEYFNNNDNRHHITAYSLRNIQDYSIIKEDVAEKELVLLADSMVEFPLHVAEKLQQIGINCKVRIFSYDNGPHQNTEYDLDEYIGISKVMEELIGDIDDNLPEEEKFRIIYERVVNHIEYDYPAAYPQNKEQEKYSNENATNCRDLRNGLLFGKAVCAGYADILKNACLLKGIECENVNGPVDSIESKDCYLTQSKKQKSQKELLYVGDNYVVTREYHAWNKVKINGVWYNCDPTWDKTDISNNRTPMYALLSDDTLKKLGRPTATNSQHPCNNDLFGAEKSKIFHGREPCGDLIAINKLIEFESTLNEDGRPRQLPVVPKEYPWTRIVAMFKYIMSVQQAGIKKTIDSIKMKISPKLNKKISEQTTEKIPIVDEVRTEEIPVVEEEITEEIPVVEEEITEELPVVGDEITGELPIVKNEITEGTEKQVDASLDKKKSKRPSWELSEEELKAVKQVEGRNASEEKQPKTQEKEGEKQLGE